MGYYDDLGDCDLGFFRQPCVYLKDGPDDNSCVRPNCSKCWYSGGRKPYCQYAYNGSCTYYNCAKCDEATEDNYIWQLWNRRGKHERYS